MPASARYDVIAIALHWLSAALVLGLIATGLSMEVDVQRASMFEYQLFQLHKSLGITVLLLSLLRLGWRLGHRPPPLPASMPGWERAAARITHGLFYLFLLGLPLLGWAAVSASPLNIPTVLYGSLPWPDLPLLGSLPDRRAVSGELGDIHASGAWILIALLALHVAAALRHQFLLRDGTLGRMLPAAARLSEKRP